MTRRENFWYKFFNAYHLNKDQLQFASYAAEISFYTLWAMVPLLYAMANVISLLPIHNEEVIVMLRTSLPQEIQPLMLPALSNFLTHTSKQVFSVSLIISLWPASNIFHSVQRVFNQIYKVKPRKNFFISRAFAYLFTIIMVLLVFIVSSVLTMGQTFLTLLGQHLPELQKIVVLVINKGWIFSLLVIYFLLVVTYYVIPNVRWPLRYALPGATFAFLGFLLVSQLFNLYLVFAKTSISNQTFGVFMILIIWIYLNSMVVTIGAFLNVFYYDYVHGSLIDC